MKRINLIIISSVAILAILNLFREDKPLQIEPMYAETYNWVSDTGWVYVDEPVSLRIDYCYYLRNFHNNKHDLKTILKFLEDSSYILSEDSSRLILNDEFMVGTTFCLQNNGYFDDGVQSFYGKSIKFCPSSIPFDKLHYIYIDIDSKYKIFPTDVNTPPNPKSYEYQLDIHGDSAIVTIDYSELSTDILQQFLNVVDYYKDDIPIERNGVNTYISHPNPPIIYILKKEKSNRAEVIINYHYKKSARFTIEII